MAIERIEEACKCILAIKEEDFREMIEIAEGQKNYAHPLKMATAKWQHDLGEYNEKVVKQLIELQETLKGGANIRKP